ncbi:thymidylate synthase [Alteriqipengyuania flavescens]|uniref:thymidylate synthase n=1 Tax=Alteriqipengyuania flavescens TaxID=3053610 RepID=UPI0025B562AB|nr:thymidylate synthase [Alteriqipengyuania flavescens]WJY18439.1 thymidylate synthase [Alteriqipengyuania flavescens]WJY24380.1 thymidylate synthase [Alteriqipengyuania flavescens]
MVTLASAPDSPLGTAADAHYELPYLQLMRHVWEKGDERRDRTGVGTRSVFGATLRFSLADGRMPLITTKRVYWKTATRELLWFLTGNTNIRPLVLQGVGIWNEWPHANYVRATGDDIALDTFVARIAQDEDFAARWGDLGPVYGKQWVDWPTYEPAGECTFRAGPGINQVAQVVESLRHNPGSRRHIIEGWNVAELDRMALPPCHKTYQFHVAGDRLNCALYQRSCDVALGLPFNLWSAALLTAMMAQQTGLKPGELVWMGGDTHLYLNHAELVETQLAREPQGEPRLEITRTPRSIFDYAIEDFAVTGYTPHPPIKAPVAV